MSRILMIVGSRREGNSIHLAKSLKTIFDKNRISSDIIVPGNQKIYLCTGCMDCDKNGVCDFNDDMKVNIDKVNNAEVLLFITPTRWNTLSGDLKIFIDRLNPLYSEKKLKDKKMIVLVYKAFFDNCLNYPDILNYNDKIESVANDIINVIN